MSTSEALTSDDVVRAMLRLLHRDDVMPHESALVDMELVLDFIADQEDEEGMRDAIQRLRSAIQVAQLAQPGAYF